MIKGDKVELALIGVLGNLLLAIQVLGLKLMVMSSNVFVLLLVC